MSRNFKFIYGVIGDRVLLVPCDSTRSLVPVDGKGGLGFFSSCELTHVVLHSSADATEVRGQRVGLLGCVACLIRSRSSRLLLAVQCASLAVDLEVRVLTVLSRSEVAWSGGLSATHSSTYEAADCTISRRMSNTSDSHRLSFGF